MEEPKTSQSNQNEIICKNCGAKLIFAPGTDSLNCEFCGTINEIKVDTSKVQEATKEIDFYDFINNQMSVAPSQEITTIACTGCGATTSFNPNVVSDSCPFCSTPLVAKQTTATTKITPKAMLPFKVTEKESLDLFTKWLKGLWWAPNNLKKYARQKGKLAGLYIPYWTFDANTNTSYTGQRGDDYQEEEEYTNSEGETETRTVTRTEWTSVSGRVYNNFDDVLVVASKSLPHKLQDKLEPWDLNNLVPYDDKYLAGFRTETYQVDLKEGLDVAKDKMDTVIRSSIRSDIGGDHQRISSMNTSYSDVTFKHILLPIWLSAYKYNDKVYRFIVNGRTGEVKGERPYSWIKITLAVILALAIIGIIIYFANKS